MDEDRQHLSSGGLHTRDVRLNVQADTLGISNTKLRVFKLTGECILELPQPEAKSLTGFDLQRILAERLNVAMYRVVLVLASQDLLGDQILQLVWPALEDLDLQLLVRPEDPDIPITVSRPQITRISLQGSGRIQVDFIHGDLKSQLLSDELHVTSEVVLHPKDAWEHVLTSRALSALPGQQSVLFTGLHAGVTGLDHFASYEVRVNTKVCRGSSSHPRGYAVSEIQNIAISTSAELIVQTALAICYWLLDASSLASGL